MDPFELTEEAIFDIDDIWEYLLKRESLTTADRIVEQLFRSFYRIAANPAIGHRRTDLTSRPVLFYRLYSWLIVFNQPGTASPDRPPVKILAVLHGKRNLSRLLSRRSLN